KINQAIANLGENITIRRFARFKVGEVPGAAATPAVREEITRAWLLRREGSDALRTPQDFRGRFLSVRPSRAAANRSNPARPFSFGDHAPQLNLCYNRQASPSELDGGTCRGKRKRSREAPEKGRPTTGFC